MDELYIEWTLQKLDGTVLNCIRQPLEDFDCKGFIKSAALLVPESHHQYLLTGRAYSAGYLYNDGEQDYLITTNLIYGDVNNDY